MAFDSQEQSRDTGASPAFPPTHWSLVVAAGQSEASRAAEALESLCRAYWYPLYALARRSGHSPADAQDLTQGFFQHLLETELVGKADARKGRFRSFLLVSFRNYMLMQRAREQAAKRGGGQILVSFDTREAEERFARTARTLQSPEAIYDRSWAVAVLDQALGLLRSEFEAGDRMRVFQEMQPFLEGDAGSPSYAEVARRLGTTEGTIKVTVSRLRRRLRDVVRSIVARTVTHPAEVEEELGHLVAILRG